MSNARKLADNLPIEGSISGRNKLINGSMEIFQRGTSFSSTSAAYNADRWLVDNNGGGGGRSTDAPDGFNYSLKVDPSSGSNAVVRQAIELSAAGEGGVFRSGQKFTLSFYLKSDNAGEAINIFIASGTNVSATTTSQVNDTSTGLTTTTSWTRYTYTYTSNNVGGSDTCYNIVPYVSNPSGATYWTGLMLEEGSHASPFEHEPKGVLLNKCQRYYWQAVGSGPHYYATQYSSGYRFVQVDFGQEMRATPTVTVSYAAGASLTNYLINRQHWKAYLPANYDVATSYRSDSLKFDAEF